MADSMFIGNSIRAHGFLIGIYVHQQYLIMLDGLPPLGSDCLMSIDSCMRIGEGRLIEVYVESMRLPRPSLPELARLLKLM